MIDRNDLSMKDAYRIQMGLLTSDEIEQVRQRYQISQTDLAAVLGWEQDLITRFESHLVQDKAHDDLLRRFDLGPHGSKEKRDQCQDRVF